MATPVVIVTSGGIPVTQIDNGTPLTVATNGYGIAVTQVSAGGIPVNIDGSTPPVTTPPTILATNTYGGPVAGSHNINLPAGIQAGDLLIVEMASSAIVPGLEVPVGWTAITNEISGTGSSGRRLVTMRRTADGLEGATVTVTIGGGMTASCGASSYRIGNWTGTPEGASAPGTGVNPNPPNLAPSWGAVPTLYLAGFGGRAANITGTPTNYTNLLTGLGGTNSLHGSVRRELSVVSEDPAAFTQDAADVWVAATIAIQGT